MLLINNQGDILATLEQIGSVETLTSLGASMLTAGLTTGLTEAAGLGGELPSTAPLGDRVAQDIAQGAIAVGVDTGVSTIVEGQELGDALLDSLRTEAAGVLGENVAQEIGAAVASGDLDTAGQLIAHGALGCATGAIAAGDCASGAAGAVIGEATALIYKEQIEGWLSDAEAFELDQFLDQAGEMQQAGVDLAKLTSGLLVGLAGGDVDVAAGAGANAAEHNAGIAAAVVIGVAAIALEALDKTLLGRDIGDFVEALRSGDTERAAKLAPYIGTDVGMEMTLGSAVPGSYALTKLLRRLPLWLVRISPEISHAVRRLTNRIPAPTDLGFPTRSIQHTFSRHAHDFGITENWNKQTAAEFQQVLTDHITTNKNVVAIKGTHRTKVEVTHYYDPATRLNVMIDKHGNLEGAWKLDEDQITNLMNSGNVQ